MDKQIIHTANVPSSTSPVSQACAGAGLIFTGGQMPRDRDSGKIVDDIRTQAELSVGYCLELIRAAGSDASKVVLAFVYLTDLSAKNVVNEVFARHFPSNPPARNLVEVSQIGEGATVEVSMIALA